MNVYTLSCYKFSFVGLSRGISEINAGGRPFYISHNPNFELDASNYLLFGDTGLQESNEIYDDFFKYMNKSNGSDELTLVSQQFSQIEAMRFGDSKEKRILKYMMESDCDYSSVNFDDFSNQLPLHELSQGDILWIKDQNASRFVAVVDSVFIKSYSPTDSIEQYNVVTSVNFSDIIDVSSLNIERTISIFSQFPQFGQISASKPVPMLIDVSLEQLPGLRLINNNILLAYNLVLLNHVIYTGSMKVYETVNIIETLSKALSKNKNAKANMYDLNKSWYENIMQSNNSDDLRHTIVSEILALKQKNEDVLTTLNHLATVISILNKESREYMRENDMGTTKIANLLGSIESSIDEYILEMHQHLKIMDNMLTNKDN